MVREILDVVAIGFLLLGSVMALAAGVGLVRFPDVISRLHAGTKPQVAGVLLIMVGGAIRLAGTPVVWMLLLGGLLQMLTVPVSAHMISRIAYRRRHVREDLLVVHEAGFAGLADLQDDPPGDQPADAPRDQGDSG
ncbi:multisubunit sodium/proton antiporter MrpG subunit [Blastococcus xanthinilyticus]|uniref:Multisubunit sodium/proton antiporter MrpG subunit n=1 Tax=Blastococcus xanthinilyticus TaxID=1564164 RepID=A0A5S5CTM3_9ACTN|nr:multisubunit sodium/proton antiporter MrpG subunit [Blastococcus xanthinilyticus]